MRVQHRSDRVGISARAVTRTHTRRRPARGDSDGTRRRALRPDRGSTGARHLTGSPETPGAPTPAVGWFNLGGHVSDLANALQKGAEQAAEPHGLIPAEIMLLAACGRLEECTASQLAPLLPVDASRVSRLVNGLVERGLLRRRRIRSDRRLVMLRLSPEGHEVTTAVAAHLDAYYARLIAGLSEDQMRAFAETAQAIAANYEEIRDP
ncbi:MAG: winged helix-turn-helix transcriptional regulator [Chloroflexi bacterium]|nr:winged helix-turn-helix transcriptional regulator [Chloroflexota bacterium]